MHRIIFTGTDKAGRECAISAISDVPVTRVSAGGSVSPAVDYGVIYPGSENQTDLYGISERSELDPGQGPAESGSLGVVILLDNRYASPLRDLQRYLGVFEDLIRRSSVVIGVTQMGGKARPTIEDYQREVERTHPQLPVYEVDPRKGADVSMLVLTLFYCIDPGFAA